MGMPVPCAGYLSSFKFPLIINNYSVTKNYLFFKGNLKLLIYPAQGTGIPIIVREDKLFIL
jgi:hypothetical protein